MKIKDKLHFLHRAWRYRLRSEKFSIRFMRSRLRPGDTVLDIGANRGLYIYWMSKSVGPGGRIIAFEPQPELQDVLADVCDTFGFSSVEVVQKGLSTEPGTLLMRRPDYNWGGASFEKRKHTGHLDEFEVEVVRLDDWIETAGVENVSFVKCDVEGHESKVFAGGEQFLRKQKPALLFECDDADDPDCEVFRFLEGIGYRGFCFHDSSPGGLAPIGDYAKLKPELHPKALKDFVFLHEEECG